MWPVFIPFTNGTLIDENFIEDMLRVKNLVPAISVEGFGDATDDRRGQGVFEKVEKAMALLKKNKLPFGLSTCYTRANVDVISSEEYIDYVDHNLADLVLVPGLSFDKRGYRTGYGGGFYDRFFASITANCTKVGYCFSVQISDEDLPTDQYDIAVDYVITD